MDLLKAISGTLQHFTVFSKLVQWMIHVLSLAFKDDGRNPILGVGRSEADSVMMHKHPGFLDGIWGCNCLSLGNRKTGAVSCYLMGNAGSLQMH